jgi:putative CocE/NonD family hydrolase
VIPQSAEFDPYHVGVLGGMASRANEGTPTAQGGTNQVAQRDATAVAVYGPHGASELAKAVASHGGNFDSPGQLPFRDSVSTTVGVPWWMVTNPSAHLEALKRPGMGVMVTANWDEAGTRHGAFMTMRNLTPGQVKMIAGPGGHCGWNVALRDAGMDIDIEQLRFFDYWLKGVKNGVMEEDPVTYYTYNAPEGRAWQTAKAWPPISRQTDYFLTARALRTDKPSQAGSLAAPMVAPVRISSIGVTTGAGSVSYERARRRRRRAARPGRSGAPAARRRRPTRGAPPCPPARRDRRTGTPRSAPPLRRPPAPTPGSAPTRRSARPSSE